MQTPAYEEVIERYGLEILKVPGDLVVKDGNIAVSRGRNLMLQSEEYSALVQLVHGWRYNAPTLQSLFDLVFTTKNHRKDLGKSSNQALAGRQFSRYHELNVQIGVSDAACAVYAGAIVLVLGGLLLAFKQEVAAEAADWNATAPLIAGCSVGPILVASGNNFRHNDEWMKDRLRPTSKQLSSIRVLAAAFQEPIASDGAGHPFGRHICAETLQLLSSGSFDKLSANVFAYAHNVAQKRLSRDT